jgi:membrane-bound serine protease (ClpP class)
MKTPMSLRLVLAGLLCLFSSTRLFAADAPTAPAQAPAPAPDKAAVIFLTGEVNDYTRDDLFKRFAQARQLGAKVIILRIDTYGGLVTAGLDISRFLRDQTDVHTIAFIKNKAISAGALVAVACDEIVMSPGSQLGDCAPIIFDTGGQLEPLPAAERAKEQSPILADFAESARRNGYDPLVVEAMVRVETVVHVVVNDKGEKRYVDDKDYAKLVAQGWKPFPGIPDPVDGADTLLTVGPEIAAILGLSKGIEPTADALANDRHLTIVADLSPTAGDSIVELLGNPLSRLLLLITFLMALNIALHAPGHGLAEATALISLALLLGVPLLTGYAQWWEILVILIGLALCAFEIFVFPGHGLSLALGGLMVIVGLVMTFVAKEPAGPGWLPNMQETWIGVRTGLLVVVGGLLCSMFLSAWLRRYLPSIPYFKRLVLTETTGNRLPVGRAAPAPDAWPFVGSIGEAVSELKPGGSARFPFADDTRTTSVVSASGFIPPGGKIAVQEVRGSRVVVRQIG